MLIWVLSMLVCQQQHVYSYTHGPNHLACGDSFCLTHTPENCVISFLRTKPPLENCDHNWTSNVICSLLYYYALCAKLDI